MKFIGKTLIFMTLVVVGVTVQGADKRKLIRVHSHLNSLWNESLQNAVEADDSDYVAEMLSIKANPNAWIDQIQGHKTVLSRAVERGCPEVVKLLLENRADPDCADVRDILINKVISREPDKKYYEILFLFLKSDAGFSVTGELLPENIELQKVITRYREKIKQEIAKTTSLTRDPRNIVAGYVI